MNYELLFVVDENDNPLPPLERKEVIASKLWRRACGGAVINKRRQVLCQKRSDKVDERPGLWVAMFGGKSAPGEEPVVTAQRELREELGLVVELSELSFYKKIKAQERHQFEYLYSVEWTGELSEIDFDPGEVSKIAWRDISEVVELLAHDKDWYSYGYDIAMLQAINAD
jgi:8-oxo-dGTP pyrophosphatase MutT (NUDIX family)